jgi:hypothetical protein
LTTAPALTTYGRTPWAQHIRALEWKQGDHMLISAPTNAGKTTMAHKLSAKRSHVVVFVSKMKDPTFVNEFKDFERLTEWPKGGPRGYQDKILLWPKPEKLMVDTLEKQREVFDHAINAILHQGNRCVVIDESLMMTDPRYIGLGKQVGLAHYYGRSAGITMLSLTQRPSWIPKVIYSSVSHAYIASTKDRDDARKLSDMGGIDAREVGHNLMRLPTRHDYVYLNPLGDASPTIVNTRR